MSARAVIDELVLTRTQLARDPRTLAQLRALQAWQVQRLQSTYEDYAADPRYRAALEFFVQDLYGPHDFARRDRDLRKVLRQWERLLPQRALQAVIRALELEALSQSLDLAVVAALGGAAPTLAYYAQAYRRAGRREDRQRQIWLIVAAGRSLDALIGIPGLGAALRTARLPARMMGVTHLHDFLERGYKAFKTMGGANELLGVIEERETTILRRLFAGGSDPFRIEGPPSAARTS